MKVDLPWLSFEKPTVIDLDKLDIRVPYGAESQYRISLGNEVVHSKSLRAGIIAILTKTDILPVKCQPDKILKAIEKLPGEQGKKLIRSALGDNVKPFECNVSSGSV